MSDPHSARREAASVRSPATLRTPRRPIDAVSARSPSVLLSDRSPMLMPPSVLAAEEATSFDPNSVAAAAERQRIEASADISRLRQQFAAQQEIEARAGKRELAADRRLEDALREREAAVHAERRRGEREAAGEARRHAAQLADVRDAAARLDEASRAKLAAYDEKLGAVQRELAASEARVGKEKSRRRRAQREAKTERAWRAQCFALSRDLIQLWDERNADDAAAAAAAGLPAASAPSGRQLRAAISTSLDEWQQSTKRGDVSAVPDLRKLVQSRYCEALVKDKQRHPEMAAAAARQARSTPAIAGVTHVLGAERQCAAPPPPAMPLPRRRQSGAENDNASTADGQVASTSLRLQATEQMLSRELRRSAELESRLAAASAGPRAGPTETAHAVVEPVMGGDAWQGRPLNGGSVAVGGGQNVVGYHPVPSVDLGDGFVEFPCCGVRVQKGHAGGMVFCRFRRATAGNVGQ